MTRWIVASFLLVLPLTASAQPGPRQDRRELRQDRRELRQDRRELRDDRRDAQRFSRLLQSYDAARAANQIGALTELDGRVQAAIDEELRESGREVNQKAAEAGRSQAEVGRERREVARDVDRGRPGQAAGDVRDLRDDRRDAHDDRRDLRWEQAAASQLAAIQQEYRSLLGRVDPGSLDRKRTLLAQVAGLSRAELSGDRQEIREDRRERREDRRELREDRRGR
jgi:hypothetical protein